MVNNNNNNDKDKNHDQKENKKSKSTKMNVNLNTNVINGIGIGIENYSVEKDTVEESSIKKQKNTKGKDKDKNKENNITFIVVERNGDLKEHEIKENAICAEELCRKCKFKKIDGYIKRTEWEYLSKSSSSSSLGSILNSGLPSIPISTASGSSIIISIAGSSPSCVGSMLSIPIGACDSDLSIAIIYP
jgi:hypothetical protein